MKSLVKQLLNKRIVRYGLVGGIGIPVNDLALFVFKYLLHTVQLTTHLFVMSHHITIDFHYALASACAFEISTTLNFVLNQLFTYHEQKLYGWDWLRRAGKAQLTSLSAQLLTFAVGLVLVYGLNVNDYIANPVGIIVVFVYGFFLSRKFVFRPITDYTRHAKEGRDAIDAL
jgi:putative flippase GtrA